jgi:hypothetical protein
MNAAESDLKTLILRIINKDKDRHAGGRSIAVTTSELLTRGAPLPRPAERRLSMPSERLMNHSANPFSATKTA